MITNLDFVKCLYSALLKREPDLAIDEYVRLLDSDLLSPHDLLMYFSQLDEVYERATPSNRSRAIALLYADRGPVLGDPYTWQLNERALVFYHFPKTGGISLSNFLAENFHPLQIPGLGGMESGNKFSRYFAGHYVDWGEYKSQVPLGSITITCLRNPSARLRSLYAFLPAIHESIEGRFFDAAMLAASKDYLGFFCSKKPSVVNAVNNVYVRSLSGYLATESGDPLLARPDEALDVAMERLEGFQMIYLLEEVKASGGSLPSRVMSVLEQYFGRAMDPCLPNLNKTPNSGLSQEIPSAIIESNTFLDNILYDRIASANGLKIRAC